MKIKKLLLPSILLSFTFSLFLFICCSSNTEGPNLVPTTPSTAPNYWCTWYAQNYWIGRGTNLKNLNIVSNTAAREQMNYKNIFNTKDGWATSFMKRNRNDFYFLIDHGWQTKKKDERIKGANTFFSLQIDTLDFPQYAGNQPQEQLRLFNKEIQSLGWRGLGIWVRGNLSPKNAEKFVKWSKYAGIKYWKIDGGDTSDFNAYQAKQKFYPELELEYVAPILNLNPNWNQPNLECYPSPYFSDSTHRSNTLRILKNTDILRTYDATPQLMSTTTLRRVHDILKMTAGHPEYIAKLNLQDDCNTAPALGCLVASKRHPNFNERTYKNKDLHHQLNGKRHMQGRINEAERFGYWERIAPAFSCGEGTYVYSSKELIDYFPYNEYSTFNKGTYNKTVYQSAPAIMARNMALPKVTKVKVDTPHIMATTYPNGVVCVATEGRVKPSNEWYYPKVSVEINIKKGSTIIGVFGYYDQLILNLSHPITNLQHIWAQDLLAKSSIDIMEKIKVKGNKIIIPGKLLEKIGTEAATKGDISSPGLVIKLCKKE